jgi:hypothetical protein
MSFPKTIEINGRHFRWRDLLKIRRKQRKAVGASQLTLFELHDDSRPLPERTADSRYREPSLFTRPDGGQS